MQFGLKKSLDLGWLYFENIALDLRVNCLQGSKVREHYIYKKKY